MTAIPQDLHAAIKLLASIYLEEKPDGRYNIRTEVDAYRAPIVGDMWISAWETVRRYTQEANRDRIKELQGHCPCGAPPGAICKKPDCAALAR